MSRKQKPVVINTREHGALGVYLHEIAQSAPLSADEERQLAAQMAQGNQQAKNRLVAAHLKFVVSVAKQYVGQGLALDDLVNEGNIGLIRAAERFDASKGQRFVLYAVWSIRKSIEKALHQEADTVGLSRELQAGPAGDADSQLLTDAQQEELLERMAQLTEREQQVLKAFYGIQQPAETFAEIAAHMGLKRERVRQIRKKGLRKLKRK